MRASVLVQTIRQLLAKGGEGGDTPDGAGLAQLYTECCTQANARLVTCAGLAREGRVAESVHLADEPPALLDLCVLLDFPEAENWRMLCQQQAWSVAPVIDSSAISMLNTAYASGIPLEPLMQEYRKAMRRGNRGAAVPVLRRLVAADPSNPAWKEDLAAFEARRLDEMAAEVSRLEAAGDLTGLAGLANELSGQWLRSIPSELRTRIDTTLAAAERQAEETRFHATLAALPAAYSARDVDRCEALVREGATLMAVHGFVVPPEASPLSSECRAWVVETRRAEQEEAAWTAALGRLAQAVESADASEIRSALDGLARFDRALPEPLEDRALEIVETYDLAHARAQRLRVIFGVAAAMAVIVAAALAARHFAFKKRVHTVAATLQELHDAQNLIALTNRLAFVSVTDARIWRSEPVQRWVGKAEAMSKAWLQESARIDAFLTEIERLADEHFPETQSSTDHLITQAKQACQHPVATARQTARLVKIVQAWNQACETHRLASESVWEKQAGETRRAVVAFGRAVQDGTADASVAILRDAAEAALVQAEQAVCDDAGRQALERLTQEMETSRKLNDKRTTLIARIESTTMFPDFFEAAAALARDLPLHPLAVPLTSYANRRHIYEEFLFGATDVNDQNRANNRFWARAAPRIALDSTGRNQAWKAFQQQLRDWEQEAALVDVWEWRAPLSTGGTIHQSRLIYLRGKPTKRAQGDYLTMQFDPAQNNRTSSPTFEEVVERSPAGEMKKAPYCDAVQAVLFDCQLGRAEMMSTVLDKMILQLCENEKIPPLLQLKLLQSLGDTLDETLAAYADPGVKGRLQILKEREPEDLHWLCTGHTRFKFATEAAQRLVDTVKSRSPDAVRFEYALREGPILCGVRFDGIVPLDGRIEKRFATTRAREIWAILPDGKGGDRLMIVAFKRADGKWQWGDAEIKAAMTPGLPLFAPVVESTTAERLGQIAEKYKKPLAEVAERAARYPMWPQNCTLAKATVQEVK